MDYNEWLLDYYTIMYAPMTATAGFSKFVALLAGGAMVASFSGIIFGFYSDNILTSIMPGISTSYATNFYDPTDTFLEDTVIPFLSNYGLDSVGNMIDQLWEAYNYVVIDVVFAFLSGELTSDPNYA
jgi:hypothetical protein